MSSASFKRLANKVAASYRRKGVSARTARKWGNATAAKVVRQKAKRK
jgi:hypothetical protein